jgi:hypothetical protein
METMTIELKQDREELCRVSVGPAMKVVLVLAIFLLGGCYRLPSTEASRLRHSVEKTIVASDLEKWATNCLAQGVVTTTGASESIRQVIRECEGRVSVSKDGPNGEGIVLFVYGGGFGHWGLAVGGTDYKCGLGNAQTHWTNGIWFWNE